MAYRLKPSFRGPGLSDSTIQSSRSGGSSEKADELEQINEDADRVAGAFIAELKRCAAEHRARAAQRLNTLATHSFNPAEISRIAKSAAADAAKVKQARRGTDLEDDIVFADEVLRTASEARAARSLVSEVRRVSNRSSRIGKEVAALQKVVHTPIQFKTPESTDVIEWRAEAAHIEEKIKIFKKKLDNLRVPSQYALQKRHDECLALKAELDAAQERVKQYDGLPPSLAQAAFKLEQAEEEWARLRIEIRNAKSFGFAY